MKLKTTTTKKKNRQTKIKRLYVFILASLQLDRSNNENRLYEVFTALKPMVEAKNDSTFTLLKYKRRNRRFIKRTKKEIPLLLLLLQQLKNTAMHIVLIFITKEVESL